MNFLAPELKIALGSVVRGGTLLNSAALKKIGLPESRNVGKGIPRVDAYECERIITGVGYFLNICRTKINCFKWVGTNVFFTAGAQKQAEQNKACKLNERSRVAHHGYHT